MRLAHPLLLLLLIVAVAPPLFGFDNDKLVPEYMIVKNERDPGLTTDEAVFIFTFNNIPASSSIKAACNRKQKTVVTDAQGKYMHKTKPGQYTFQLFYNEEYFEIYTENITIEPGYKIEIDINFQPSVYPVIVEKPVIYCYPAKKTPIHIDLALQGDLLFTYPAYKNGWDFMADTNGTIYTNGKSFKYLFWEGETKINTQTIHWNEGSIVATTDLLPFLENSLTQMGMNSREQQDFITYWYPQMMKNEKNYVHFVFNEEYNDFAEMHIDPKPDHMLRVYMLCANASDAKNVSLTNQPIPVLKREGFTLVEWGGSELPEMPVHAF